MGELIKLLKPCVVIFDENGIIEGKLTNNGETNPRDGAFYAEFDTSEEMEQFIISEGLNESIFQEKIRQEKLNSERYSGIIE